MSPGCPKDIAEQSTVPREHNRFRPHDPPNEPQPTELPASAKSTNPLYPNPARLAAATLAQPGRVLARRPAIVCRHRLRLLVAVRRLRQRAHRRHHRHRANRPPSRHDRPASRSRRLIREHSQFLPALLPPGWGRLGRLIRTSTFGWLSSGPWRAFRLGGSGGRRTPSDRCRVGSGGWSSRASAAMREPRPS